MPFVKLDCDMLESSLWDWTPERHIFITALLMAKPFELKEPTPQLQADSLESTGWIVPPGKYGFVNASGSMIIKKALSISHIERLEGGEDYKEAVSALGMLGEPDDDSRSQAFEGRRLVRVDGGYIVLNYQRFRDKDHTATERKKRQREKEKMAAAEVSVTRDVTKSHKMSLDVTQAEAEAYTEAEEEDKTLSTSSTVVRQVFDYWREVMDHPKAVLDTGRSALIRARLKDRDGEVRDLLRAIDGCRASSYHMGENDTRKVHDGIKLIFRSNDDLERFMGYNVSVPKGKLETFSEPALDVEPDCTECFDTGEVLRPKPGGADWEMQTVPCPECAGEKI